MSAFAMFFNGGNTQLLKFAALAVVVLMTCASTPSPHGRTTNSPGFKCANNTECRLSPDANDWGICYKDGYCHCQVGRVWVKKANSTYACVRINCTEEGKECDPYGWECQGTHCACRGGTAEDFHFSVACISDPKCRRDRDCQKPLRYSVCYLRRCHCKYGFLRVSNHCIQLPCVSDTDCGPVGSLAHCDSTSATCGCLPGSRLAPNELHCIPIPGYQPAPNSTPVNIFADEEHEKVEIIIIIVFLLLLILGIGLVFCVWFDSIDSAGPSQPFLSPIGMNQQQLLDSLQTTKQLSVKLPSDEVTQASKPGVAKTQSSSTMKRSKSSNSKETKMATSGAKSKKSALLKSKVGGKQSCVL